MAAVDFELRRLDAFLHQAITGLEGDMTLQRIGGGQSNPTYFVSYDNRSMVLRKQPGSNLLPSAHAVDREYRIMNALAATDVPVPRTLLFHAERDVVGTPFYMMERLEGRIFPSCALPGMPPSERHAIYLAIAETMARLHQVVVVPGPDYLIREQVAARIQWRGSKTLDSRLRGND